MTSQNIIEEEITDVDVIIDEELERWKERMCQYRKCPNLSVKGYVYCEEHLYGSPQKAPQWVLEALGFASTKKKNRTSKDAEERILPMIKGALEDATEGYLVALREELCGFIADLENELAMVRGQIERGERERLSEEEVDQAISNMEKAFDEALMEGLKKVQGDELHAYTEGDFRTDRSSKICGACPDRHSPVKCVSCQIPTIHSKEMDIIRKKFIKKGNY